MGETNHVGSLGGGFNEHTNEANKVAENSELRESVTENYGREGPAGSVVSEMQIELTPLLSNSIRIFQSINLNMASVSLVSHPNGNNSYCAFTINNSAQKVDRINPQCCTCSAV